ncbi:hypothetical protein [Sphingobacterium deserti]|uniref:Uncharacterized protein n=1 Tax=Sphingobacterium deserti TaxID=1229276 RepID=A0A0B8T6C2_9SPHI|nr:hypothetical protein [Sphingobacterium deserti]KGE13544.1 hypothetical protein DI53_2732 [Sphingobacterium deserti]
MEFQTLVDDPYRGLRFRIHLENNDFIVRLLKTEITKETKEIKILLDGMPKTLRKDDLGTWQVEGIATEQHFARAIWNCISLRYRI